MSKFLLHSPLWVGLLLVPALGWADFEAGVDAIVRGDYDTALAEFRPVAEQGDAKAQFHLGLMYANGEGVPPAYQEAVKWLRRGAGQGTRASGGSWARGGPGTWPA